MSKVKRIQVLVTLEFSIADENEGTLEGIDAESMVDNVHDVLESHRKNGELTPHNICADFLECKLSSESIVPAVEEVIKSEYDVGNLDIVEVENTPFPQKIFTVSHSSVPRHYTDQVCAVLDDDFADELGLLYMSLKEGFVPDTMFTDGHSGEPSTVIYVAKMADGSYVSSDETSDEDGQKLFKMIGLYEKGQAINIAKVNFDDNLV